MAHHAYRIKGRNKSFLISDRIIVTFEKPPTEGQVSRLINDHALELTETLSDREYVFRLTDDTQINPVKLVVQLTEAQAPNVKTVNHDLNMIFRPKNSLAGRLPVPPSDPVFSKQWHLHDGFKHQDVDPRSSTRCLDAWKLLDSYGDPGVVIGITDDGCQLDHSDFNGSAKFADWGYWEGNDLVHSKSIGADSARMYDAGANHGTSCAGVAAAEADASLTVGAAPACRLLPIKWPHSGGRLFITFVRMVKMLDFVADKVDILSNSWGGAPDNEWPHNVTGRIRDLAKSEGRRGKGILFLWAAGNNNSPIQHNGVLKIPYTSGWCQTPGGTSYWCGVQTSTRFSNDLATIPGVMHVAALASTAKRSHYSNYGPGIDICAPSNNIHTYRRLYVKGRGIVTTTGPTSANRAAEVTDLFGGTSSATPLVAGIAALVISAKPDITALELQKYLAWTASKDLNVAGYPKTLPAPYDPNTSWDVSPVVPYDRSNFDAQGWSPWFGYGRVDAHKAVALAKFNVATTLLTPTVEFKDVPEGESTWRAIAWDCIGFKPLTFEVVNGPDAPFSLLFGRKRVTIQPRVNGVTKAWFWLGYSGTREGDRNSGTINVRCQETNEEWALEISANVVKHPSVAVALVLDKSTSMGWDSDGNTRTQGVPKRIELLREASWNFVNLVPAGTGVAVVCFNQDANVQFHLAQIASGPSDQVRQKVRDAIAGITPNGQTSIGDGVSLADSQLPDSEQLGPYDSTAMVVVTDGQENRHQTIEAVLDDPKFDSRDNIFAVGLGEPNVIDPDKLALLTDSAVTRGREGYVILTGALTVDSHLVLTKYYHQILAGLLNSEIVRDPENRLSKDNPEISIPFNLTSLDLGVDVILLTSRNMAHEVVFLELESPEGRRITWTELPEGVEYVRESGSMVYYRFTLPVLETCDPGRIVGSPGRWLARVYCTPDSDRREEYRYALSVHVRSDIRMTTSFTQTKIEKANRTDLVVKLTESGQPLRGRTQVVAYIDGPEGPSQRDLAETDATAGQFEGQFEARTSGLYRFRVVATGRNSRNEEFTREHVRTGTIYDPDPPPEDEEDGLEGD